MKYKIVKGVSVVFDQFGRFSLRKISKCRCREPYHMLQCPFSRSETGKFLALKNIPHEELPRESWTHLDIASKVMCEAQKAFADLRGRQNVSALDFRDLRIDKRFGIAGGMLRWSEKFRQLHHSLWEVRMRPHRVVLTLSELAHHQGVSYVPSEALQDTFLNFNTYADHFDGVCTGNTRNYAISWCARSSSGMRAHWWPRIWGDCLSTCEDLVLSGEELLRQARSEVMGAVGPEVRDAQQA